MAALQQHNWIWTPEWQTQDERQTRVVMFRKCFFADQVPEHTSLQITADTRYKLYVNGTLVEVGPAKGDRQVWYVDTVDIAAWLRPGQNVLAVAVLRVPLPGKTGNHSLFRTPWPGLFVQGSVGTVEISADESWRCHIDRITEFYAEEQLFAPLCIHEHAAADLQALGWREIGFDASDWASALPYRPDQLPERSSLVKLVPRAIPFMKRTPRTFASVFDGGDEAWDRFLLGNVPLTLPAGSTASVVLDAGEEMNGYLQLTVSGGAGAAIELLEAECYTVNGKKQHRLDKEHGSLEGYTDTYTVRGCGTADMPENYEPYWFRTFRFIRLTVRVGAEPLTLHRFDYEETGYPLEVRTQVETSDKSLCAIWELSLRTLRRCMLETYVDCPFYEQLQYVMDTRSQILYTYAVAGDDRLARQAISDFSRAQRPDGLLNCSYPNMTENVIPGFSLYYVLMVYDHMMYFGDQALVRRVLPVIDRILLFFEEHLTPDGLVDKVGGVNGEAPLWSFIDWAEPWMPTQGMPAAGLDGPITMESLLYILGLQKAAELVEFVGYADVAKEYRARSTQVQNAVHRLCTAPDGMLADGPGSAHRSQHAQVFGILTGTLSLEQGRQNLLSTIGNKVYAQCTVAMCWYLFRALEQTHLYEYTNHYWEIWRRMLAQGCTTSVEAEKYARSECHAWGSLVLYELPSVILGVRPAAPGYAKIAVVPQIGYLTHASGTIHTPRGDIRVAWQKQGDETKLTIDCPEALQKDIVVTK